MMYVSIVKDLLFPANRNVRTNVRQCDPDTIFYFLFSSSHFDQLHQFVPDDTETRDIFDASVLYRFIPVGYFKCIYVFCILNMFILY